MIYNLDIDGKTKKFAVEKIQGQPEVNLRLLDLSSLDSQVVENVQQLERKYAEGHGPNADDLELLIPQSIGL